MFIVYVITDLMRIVLQEICKRKRGVNYFK